MSVMTLNRPRSRWHVPVASVAVGVLVAFLLGYIISVVTVGRGDPAGGGTVPQSAAMEQATGVRFSRVAVVGDGGLVMVEYVVLDVEKATAFQADRPHVPTLSSEARRASTQKVSIMKPGHLIRAGQTYYFVYENTGGALRSGEQVTLSYLDHVLRHVPVV